MEQDRTQLFCLLAAQSAHLDSAEVARRTSAFVDASEQEFVKRVVESNLLPEGEARRLMGIACSILSGTGDGSQEGTRAARFFQGTTLRAALTRTKNLSERLTLLPQVIDVCRAVGVAHGRGITHRGLHPEIIVISDFGECVVGNWALSKTRRKEDSQSKDVGSALEALRTGNTSALDAAFLAPELALGHMESVDARSDVYALGAVLYELLTGQPPFVGNQILHDVTSKKPESISVLEPTTPTGLVSICERAMHQEPSARYASAKHLAEEIERCVMSLPKPQADTPSVGLSVDAGSKSRIALAVVAALLVLVISVAGISQRRLVQQRNTTAATLREEQQSLALLQEERDKLSKELEEATNVRHEAEAERDKAEAERKAAIDNVRILEEQLKKAQAESAAIPPVVPPPAAAVPSSVAPAGPAPATAEPLPQSPAPPVHPKPDMPKLPAKFMRPLPEAGKADAGQRPPGVTRAEFEKVLPQLTAALKADKGAEGKTAVVIGAPGSDLLQGLQDLGFKGGDLITNVNRTPVEDLENAKKALNGVRNDPGFTVRIVRDGQSSWMRVNVFERMPEMPLAPPSAKPQAPPRLASEPQETPKAAPEQPQPEEPAVEQPSSEELAAEQPAEEPDAPDAATPQEGAQNEPADGNEAP